MTNHHHQQLAATSNKRSTPASIHWYDHVEEMNVYYTWCRPLIAHGLPLVAVGWLLSNEEWHSVTTIIVNYQIYTFFCDARLCHTLSVPSSMISSVIHVMLHGVRIEVEKSRKKNLSITLQSPKRALRDWTNSYLAWCDTENGQGFGYLGSC